MSKTNFEQALTDQLADLNKEQQPDRGLWPGIELALSSETSSSPRTVVPKRMYLVAATVAMFGLIGWLAVNQQTVSLTPCSACLCVYLFIVISVFKIMGKFQSHGQKRAQCLSFVIF